MKDMIACPNCGVTLRYTYEVTQQYKDEYKNRQTVGPRKKRKLSAWNKYVKANSKKPRFKYRNGKLNLKKMAIAFRKTPAGKKKRKR